MAMSANEIKFHKGMDSVLPGEAGVRHDGDLFKEAKWGNKNSAALVNDFAAGQAGVRHEGRLYGIIRRTEYNTAQSNAAIQGLVGAIKAMSGGQQFDEAKLLEGIGKATREAFDAALKAAVPAEVTLQVEGQSALELEGGKA